MWWKNSTQCCVILCLFIQVLTSHAQHKVGTCAVPTRVALFQTNSNCPADYVSTKPTITSTDIVSSNQVAATRCLEESKCQGYNIEPSGSGSYWFSMISQIQNTCDDMVYVYGARFYKAVFRTICPNLWEMAMEQKQGVVVSGSVGSLVTAAKSGAMFRVLVEDGSRVSLFQADQVYGIPGGHLAALAMTFTTEEDAAGVIPPWGRIDVTTEGQVSEYDSSGRTLVNTNVNITWFTKKAKDGCCIKSVREAAFEQPVFRSDLRVFNDLRYVDIFAASGKEMTQLLENIYTGEWFVSPVRTFIVNDTQVTGYSERLNDQDPVSTGMNTWILQQSIDDTDSVSYLTTNGDSLDPTPYSFSWFVDPCWEEVYAQEGDSTIFGSKEVLKTRIEEGARVRVAFQCQEGLLSSEKCVGEVDGLAVGNYSPDDVIILANITLTFYGEAANWVTYTLYLNGGDAVRITSSETTYSNPIIVWAVDSTPRYIARSYDGNQFSNEDTQSYLPMLNAGHLARIQVTPKNSYYDIYFNVQKVVYFTGIYPSVVAVGYQSFSDGFCVLYQSDTDFYFSEAHIDLNSSLGSYEIEIGDATDKLTWFFEY